MISSEIPLFGFELGAYLRLFTYCWSGVTVCVMNASLGTTDLALSARFDTRGALHNKMAIVSDNIAGSLLPLGLGLISKCFRVSLLPSLPGVILTRVLKT